MSARDGGKRKIDRLVKEAGKLRGHTCLGLPLGVKMGLTGIRLLQGEGGTVRDNMMVVVENNKCPVDGIQVATGCTAGSRRLTVLNFGKSAAVFYDGTSGMGYRVTTKPDLVSRAIKLAVSDGLTKPGEKVEEHSQLERKVMLNAFTKMTEEELFDYEKVRVGKDLLLQSGPKPRTICSRCGEEIMDGKGVTANGRTTCNSCAQRSYFVAL